MQERRRADRDKACIVGMVKGIMSYIADISETGLQLIADEDVADKGQKISIHIQVPSKTIEDAVIEGEIAWKMRKNGFYFFGIKIVNQSEVSFCLAKIKEINSFIASIRDNLLT